MPRRSRISQQTARDIDALSSFVSVFVMPVFRLSASLISGRLIKRYEYHKNLFFDIVILATELACLIILGVEIFGNKLSIFTNTAIGIGGLLLVSLMIGRLRRADKSELFGWLRRPSRGTYSIDDFGKSTSRRIEDALRIMDTTSKWYNDEDEANRELVSCLKTLHINAEYAHRLPNGRTADARIGNNLVEGKLSPSTIEVDRLIGQSSGYVPYCDKLYIVIYGKLSSDARRRIQNEICNRYIGNIILITLPNPRRMRAE